MASQNTINKNYSVQGGEVVIVETTEKVLNRGELLKEKIDYMNRQQMLLNQIAEIQKQYEVYNKAISSIDEMIAKIDEAAKAAISAPAETTT